MAMQTSRSRHRLAGFRRQPMSEINVTPMVDVMLVLLVIFMIAAPLLTVGVQVDLPKSAATSLPGNETPLAITVDAEGAIFIDKTEVALKDFISSLVTITGGDREARLVLRGDRTIHYGRVMVVMGAIDAAGFARVALVTEPIDNG